MAKIGTLALLLALALFAAFFGNVLAGALRWGEVLSDVQQVIVLFAACVSFVVGILIREAEARANTP